ncbi:MAG: hypothetical protein SAJ12_22915 [Jaaginema sp. PMC 1079.18]|nr:hypothetical protein [Jaaginema sp. PMC 1080.18]MEC4853842.1 hypothetical protein [Jaaginema sp. PMC 1079.18]MEC4865127.1 hypothetical protein [Jaaginema sp. PMC 1078.18]
MIFFTSEYSFSLLASACHAPNAFEWAAIVALVVGLVAASGVVAVSGTIAVVSVAATIVNQVMAGASVAVIVAAIEADLGTTALSFGLVTGIIYQIQEILNC